MDPCPTPVKGSHKTSSGPSVAGAVQHTIGWNPGAPMSFVRAGTVPDAIMRR